MNMIVNPGAVVSSKCSLEKFSQNSTVSSLIFLNVSGERFTESPPKTHSLISLGLRLRFGLALNSWALPQWVKNIFA